MATCSYITSMIAVGIREMKNRLSEFLRRVREGEVVLVTDRGKVVAQLTSPGANVESEDLAFDRLAAEGLLSRRGGENTPDLYPDMQPVSPDLSSEQLLDELRGDS